MSIIIIKDIDNKVLYESSNAENYLEAICEARARGITNFAGAHLPGAYFSPSVTGDAGFDQVDLSHLNFTYATLADAYFCGCNLRGVDFSHADLTRANLAETLLDGANFYEAKLTGVIWPEPAAEVPVRRTLSNTQPKIFVSLVNDED
jgi:uncharacterized protein YjbI with pentapeptide repeats